MTVYSLSLCIYYIMLYNVYRSRNERRSFVQAYDVDLFECCSGFTTCGPNSDSCCQSKSSLHGMHAIYYIHIIYIAAACTICILLCCSYCSESYTYMAHYSFNLASSSVISIGAGRAMQSESYSHEYILIDCM